MIMRAVCRWVVLAALSTASAVVVLPAAAQPAIAPAPDLAGYKRHFETAKKLAASQAWDVAATEYEAAYAAAPNLDALRAALDCYKQLHAAAKQTTTAKRILEHAKVLRSHERRALEALVKSLAPSVGAIVVTTTEPGVAVRVDGADVGLTPLPGPLDADLGAHSVKLRKAGFEPFDDDVTVAAQATVTVNAPMEAEIRTGKVVVTEAAGAALDVVIDGKVVGPVPWAGELPLGSHQVSGRSMTMAAPPQTVVVVKRQPLKVLLVAALTSGTVQVAVDGQLGVIYVDGKVIGEGSGQTSVPVGHHKVTVKREGYETAERDVDVTSGAVSTVKVSLTPGTPVGPPERPYDVYQGVYGGVSFAGLLQANQTGNQVERRCQDVGGGCTPDTEKGGGLYGYVGYTWRWIGVDAFFGGSGDTSTPTSQGGQNSWDVTRAGGLGALRAHTMIENKIVRGTLAVGLGVAKRGLFVSGGSSQYTSLVGMVDGAFALRTSSTTAIALGCMAFWENAGQDAVTNVSDSRTPFYLFSGPQFLIEPYLGLQFGP